MRWVEGPAACVIVCRMPSITLKEVPDDLHAQLQQEASAHFRSLDGEVLARLQRSFDLDASRHTGRDQRWIDEAFASGAATPLTKEEMDAVFHRVIKRRRKS